MSLSITYIHETDDGPVDIEVDYVWRQADPMIDIAFCYPEILSAVMNGRQLTWKADNKLLEDIEAYIMEEG